MNKKSKIFAGIICLAILSCTFSMQGIGNGVHATESSDFQINGTKLIAYKGNDINVAIPSTVTEIGEQAFADNTKIKSVVIPLSVTKIDYRAFSGCTSLNDVEIPDTVTIVGPGAFYNCTSLTNMEIGEKVSSWGSGVLAGCSKLESVKIDSDNPYLIYYSGALYNGDMTMLYQVFAGRKGENYVMPNTVKTIDTYAFWECENIKNVSVGTGVRDIAAYSMTNMKSVENVVLPTSVNTISQKAFADNNALKQVAIPVSVSSIHETAFDNCPNLKILTESNTIAEDYAIQHKIPCIMDAELSTSFKDSLKDDIPDTGSNKASGSTSDTNTGNNTQQASSEEKENTSEVSAEKQENSDSDVSFTNPLTTPESEDVIGKTVIVNGQAIVLLDNHKQRVYGLEQEDAEMETDVSDTSIVEEEADDVPFSDYIAERAYYKNEAMTRYTFDKGITGIGKLAFARSGLLTVTIPETVTYIGYGAFYDCENLGKITIPDGVQTIEAKAFSKTKWLEDWLSAEPDGDDFLVVGDGILLAYRGTSEDVIIPDEVRIINAEAFADHTEIKTVYVPRFVKKIGSKAFAGCTNLIGLKNCRGLETIVMGAFENTQITEDEYLLKE